MHPNGTFGGFFVFVDLCEEQESAAIYPAIFWAQNDVFLFYCSLLHLAIAFTIKHIIV